MRFSALLSGALLTATILGAPFQFPLRNNFPNPSDTAIEAVQHRAGGTLPNGPPPPFITKEGLTNLKLIALNEIFEVAFFTELKKNITHSVPGYELDGLNRTQILEAITAVKNQEELHALNANGALSHFKIDPIQPCKYNFPVTTFDEAIALASTFTDVVLGTLQDVQSIFAAHGDDGLVPGVGSIIGQEGEQNGFYRFLQKRKPSSAPFLTRSVRDFAFTAIQSFVDPGSCPNINTIDLKTFKPLEVVSAPEPANSTITLSVDCGDSFSGSSFAVTYISGQNLPVTEKIFDVKESNGKAVFKAKFPFDAGFADGLTIAAVTSGADSFSSVDDVARAAIFAPGLIELN